MEVANRVIKNTLFLYSKMIITVFSSLYTTRLVLNSLGANDFGIFTLVAGLITMLVFLNSAMTMTSQRFMSYHQGKNDLNEQKSIFSISIIFHVIIGFFLVIVLESLFFPLFEYVLKIDETRIEVAKIIYHFAVFSIFFTILSVPFDAVINSHENMFLVALLGIVESFLKLGVAFYITVYNDDKLYMYGLLMMLIVLVLYLSKLIYCIKNYTEVNFSPKKYYNKKLSKEMISFASYSLLGSASTIISSYGQNPLLNMFFGTVVNAAHGIVLQINGQLNAFANTMLKALNPVIDKSEGSGNREMMLKTSFIGIKFSFYLLVLFYITVLLEMPIIFNFWLVDVPPYTLIFCKLLLIRNLIEQLYIPLYSSIAAVGNIKKFQLYNSILSIFPLPFTYFLFKLDYEAYTLYIIFLLYSFFQGIIYVFFAYKVCDLNIKNYLNDIVFKNLLIFIFVIIISFIPHYYLEEGIIRVLLVFITSVLSILLLVWNIGLELIEKEYIFQIVEKLKAKFIKK